MPDRIVSRGREPAGEKNPYFEKIDVPLLFILRIEKYFMWLSLSFFSALMLGFYDVAKKRALSGNAVLPVLLVNTLLGAAIFLPAILSSQFSLGWFDSTAFDIPRGTAHEHALIALKAVIVLSSWTFGYFGLKNLPLTIVGPINATRPVLVLLGAMIIFGERLSGLQWAGVLLALVSLFMLGRSSRREGVDFVSNRSIWCVGAAAILGAVSGLYDKYVMLSLNPVFVQGWFNVYQAILMSAVVLILRRFSLTEKTPFHWSWAIPLITLFVTAADFAYFYALSLDGAMISIISMIRRGSVLVSFAYGGLVLREHNLRGKAVDLIFILIGMLLLYIGSR